MTDAETISALRAEVSQRMKAYNDLFGRLCDMERELQRYERMKSALWILCELTGEVYDSKKAREIQTKPVHGGSYKCGCLSSNHLPGCPEIGR